MKNNSYVTILGWMNDLDLKSNELLIYAIIYGFSQDGNSYFKGSLNYLSEWTHTSNECVCYLLKGLVEKGLLTKIEREGKTNWYQAVNPNRDNVIVKPVSVEKEKDSKSEYSEVVSNIINYLNKKLDTRYRQTSTTQNLIVSKLKTGYTYDDFVTVIDNKYNDWFNDEQFSKYLRPSTLFGNKFENYLNQKKKQNYFINNISYNNVSNSVPSVNTSIVY